MKKIPLGIPQGALLTIIEDYPQRKAVFNKKITITIGTHFGGYQILFESRKGILSAIFHGGSYGAEKGLWEIMPPKPPKSWGDSVKGYLTFQEVIKWVNKQL